MSTELTTKAVERVPVCDNSEFSNLLDTARFEHLWRLSTAFAKSTMVPQHFQGAPENVFIAMQMALRCGVDPYMFLQNCYIVHGRPGIETKLAIALLNRSGRIKGSLKYEVEGTGKTLSCTAYCVEASTGEVLKHTLTWATVEAEGWTKKSGSKWTSDPLLMIQYRAAMRLIRLHFPEVLLGMYSKDELEDAMTLDGESKPVPSKPKPSGALAGRLAAITATPKQQADAVQCSQVLRKSGLPYPRTCAVHGLTCPADEPVHGDAWEPDEEEQASIEGQLFETHPNAAEE